MRALAAPLRGEYVFFVFMYAVFVASRMLENPQLSTPPQIFYLENAADLYVVCAVLHLLPRRVRTVARTVAYVVAYVAAFSECFVHERFHLLYGPITIQLVAETTPSETGEFLSSYIKGWAFWKICLVYFPMLALNIVAEAFSRRARAQIGRIVPDVLKKATNVALPIAVAICLVSTLDQKRQMLNFFTSHDTDAAEHAGNHAFHTPLYRIVYSTKFLSLSYSELERMRANMADIKIDSCDFTIPNIVLYIGESYNKHHSQLYGYGLETTPHQKAMHEKGDLLVFSDAVTPWNVTSNVFKDVLSTHSTDQPGAWNYGVLLPGVLKKAGYKVAFITSQFYKSPNQGVVDFNGSFFLNDKALDKACFDYRNKFRKAYDGTLLHEIDKFPRGEHNFVIFHGMGQHQEYRKRYGKGGEKFVVGDYAQRRDLNVYEKQVVADYDNATRYNDNVVRLLCQKFKDEDAVVIYLPDHGEEVYDRIHSCGRDHNAQVSPDIAWAEFEVPFEIWFSPKARRLHPDVYEAAAGAQHRPFSTDDLPHLVMGMAGISSSLYDKRRDLLSPDFNAQRKRMLKGTVDYDSLMVNYNKQAER